MALVMVVSGCGSSSTTTPGDSAAATSAASSASTASVDLSDAYNSCAFERATAEKLFPGSSAFSLGDNGKSIIIAGAPMAYQEFLDALTCLLDEVGTSDALTSQIGTTTNGTEPQQASEAGLDYQWSFSSTGGLSLTVTYAE
ncbi:hypothetical protein G5V58_04105 [Nocardioides anomalus]|uniref:Uncharacterized protein n=1 Tax=Nocardioides anomalus TaxID=2712223 RepID=A0A6G6WA90_9ACTN|nr:hypothetical protein [Nocardioides anomalus]QIG42063.1 hypothetical protein G5V58_04105 [Nocardioides anomalus]